MRHHVINFLRNGLPAVGAVVGGLTVAQRKPGLAWTVAGAAGGWVSGYVAKNVLLALVGPPADTVPARPAEIPQAYQVRPEISPSVPQFVFNENVTTEPEDEEIMTKGSVGRVIDIKRPKQKKNFGDAFGES